MTVALDSWAVLAWLEGVEPATDLVDGVFGLSEPALISWINLAEVRYKLSRRTGPAQASETTAALENVLVAELPTRAIVLAAADLKAEHPMALADCFAVATAARFGLELWTGDPEIVERRSALPCAVRDLR
jgi:predicted nucleic acid-binding protein